MDTKFYNDLKIGQTILDEMLERKMVSPFIYEGLKDVSGVLLQESNVYVDPNTYKWDGKNYRLEDFERIYNDPTIRTIEQFAMAMAWERNKDNNRFTQYYNRLVHQLNNLYSKNYDEWKARKARVGGGRVPTLRAGATKGPPPSRLTYSGTGQQNRQIEAINAEDLLPGVFYTDITRILRSNHAKFWKFWDRQISALPADKTKLLGKKWEKSFIYGFELSGTKGFGYEIWYNSIDSTFSLYDTKANDVTNEHFDTLQGATRALFNAVTTDSRADLDYRMATSPTAQAILKSVAGNIDPMIQKFQQMEAKDSKEFNRLLDIAMKGWTRDEMERFKEEYTPVRYGNEFILEAARRYTKAFETLKEHLPETNQDFRNIAFTGTLDSFEKEIKDAVKQYTEYTPVKVVQPVKAEPPKDVPKQPNRQHPSAPHEDDLSDILKDTDSLLSPQERRKREDEEKRKENKRKRENPTFIDRAKQELDWVGKAKKTAKELENEARWRDENWGKGELDPSTRKQTPQEIKQNRERQFRMIAMYRPKWTDDHIMVAMRDTLTKTSIGYEKLFIDLAKHIVINYYNLQPQHYYVKELDALYNKRMANNKKPEWEQVTGGREGTFETEELFVKRIIEILEKSKKEQVLSKTGKTAAYVGDSVDDDLKLFMDVRTEAIKQLEERDVYSPEQRDFVTDIERNHSFGIVNGIRKTAERETSNQRQIQTYVNQKMLKVYNQSLIKPTDMMRWWERMLPSLFRDINVMTPYMLHKKKGWDASFITGFSLKERVNLEIWYVTEPNPDTKSRNKTISSFYVFDATAFKLIERHIPHLRHAYSLVTEKIGLLERTI